MTLIQQFPDISEMMRSKNERPSSNYKSANARQSLSYLEDEAVAQYYEGEFRRWHIKFLFIVAAVFGLTYVVILKGFEIYNMINIK